MNARKGDERQKSYNETSLVMSAKREVHQPLMKAVCVFFCFLLLEGLEGREI
jgi:hypothetical protein